MESLYKAFGERVRAVRVAAGKTQDNLARGIGRTRSSVANIEGGNQRIPLHQLYAIAQVLQCDVRDLLPPAAADRVDYELAEYPEGLREAVTAVRSDASVARS